MRLVNLLTLAVLVTVVISASIQADEPKLVRPILWWVGVNSFSDGGSGGVKESTHCFTNAEAWAKQWELLKLPGACPQVDFEKHVVVLAQRVYGLNFEPHDGLVVGEKGEARLVGRKHTQVIMNAGIWSTTIAVFPRKGIESIDGVKLTAESEYLRLDPHLIRSLTRIPVVEIFTDSIFSIRLE